MKTYGQAIKDGIEYILKFQLEILEDALNDPQIKLMWASSGKPPKTDIPMQKQQLEMLLTKVEELKNDLINQDKES